jgi:hypothetical protein
LLLTNPKISTLAGMSKVFVPLSPKQNRELLKLLSTTREFDALPQWVVAHLLKVEQMFERDKSSGSVTKHGNHNQLDHAGRRGRRLTTEAPSFTDSERDALTTYGGNETLQINHRLRGLSNTRGIQPALGAWRMSDNKIDSIVQNMDSAIDKSSLSERTTVYRDIPASSLKTGLFGSAVGKTITDRGYLSMRRGEASAAVPPPSGFVRLKVIAPAGTKALDLSFINDRSMGEIIFPRDSKIKINRVIGGAGDMEVVGEIIG